MSENLPHAGGSITNTSLFINFTQVDLELFCLPQVLHMLTGMGVTRPGGAFEWNSRAHAYSVGTTVHVAQNSVGALRAVLQAFAEMGTRARRLVSHS